MSTTNDNPDRHRSVVLAVVAEGEPGFDELAAQFSQGEPVKLRTWNDVSRLAGEMAARLRHQRTCQARTRAPRITRTRSRSRRARPARRTVSRAGDSGDGPGEPPGPGEPAPHHDLLDLAAVGRRRPRVLSPGARRVPPSRRGFQGAPAAAPGVVA